MRAEWQLEEVGEHRRRGGEGEGADCWPSAHFERGLKFWYATQHSEVTRDSNHVLHSSNNQKKGFKIVP